MRFGGPLLALLVLLSGCAQAPANDAAAAASAAAITDLPADVEIGAPAWRLGDWFGHHVFFGADDHEGTHYKTIVTSETADAYHLSSDNRSASIDEALVDIPILGPVRKADLEVTGLGATWDLFRFPMKNGTSWTSRFAVDLEDEFTLDYQLTHVATFSAAIDTPNGPRPGFNITATNQDGQVFLAYDFVPDIGWYAHLFAFDLTSDEPSDFFFHVMSMGNGHDWHGTYYDITAKPLVELVHGTAVDPDTPTQPMLEPQTPESFTMDDDATTLWGLVYSIAFAGAQETILLDPQGERHEFRAVGAPEGEEGGQIEVPAVPGEWRIASAGGGAVAIAVAFLWQLTERVGEL